MRQAQLRGGAEDLRPAAVKTGMLDTASLVETVAGSIQEHGLGNYVLDPVMVATTGARLLDQDAESAIIDALLPLCTLVTPNLDEAALLARREIESEADMRAVAEMLVAKGAGAALVKGGHLDGAEVVDVLFDGESFHEWRRPKIETQHTHGTGCTLSAAITAGLARGKGLVDAIEDALDYVHRAIASAPGLGAGHGPLNHFVAADRVVAGD